jgi:hypothetical protein
MSAPASRSDGNLAGGAVLVLPRAGDPTEPPPPGPTPDGPPPGDEEVEEADEESFPASDPPSTWAGWPTR